MLNQVIFFSNLVNDCAILASFVIFQTVYLKAKTNDHCHQIISKKVCHYKNLNLADGFGREHGSAVVWCTAVYNRHYLAAELRHGFDPKKFPFVFALLNITRSWSGILSETNTPYILCMLTKLQYFLVWLCSNKISRSWKSRSRKSVLVSVLWTF